MPEIMKYFPLFLLLTACQIEHEVTTDIPEVEVQPIVVYFCLSGWLWRESGDAVTNELTGEQRTCSEAY